MPRRSKSAQGNKALSTKKCTLAQLAQKYPDYPANPLSSQQNSVDASSDIGAVSSVSNELSDEELALARSLQRSHEAFAQTTNLLKAIQNLAEKDLAALFKEAQQTNDPDVVIGCTGAFVIKSIQRHLHFIMPTVNGTALHYSIMQAVLAILITIADGKMDGGIIISSYTNYVMLCHATGVMACSSKNFELLFKRGKKACAAAPDIDGELFSCALTKFAMAVLTDLMQQADKGALGDVNLSLQVIQAKLGVTRLLAVDGAYLSSEKTADISAEQDEGETDSGKGLSDGNARKVHVIFNLVSCSVADLDFTSEAEGDCAALDHMLARQSIKANDLLLADVGYVSDELFKKLADNGVFFIIRAKKDINSEVISFRKYNVSKAEQEHREPNSEDSEEKVDLKFDLPLFEEIKESPSEVKIRESKELPTSSNICVDADIRLDNKVELRLVKINRRCIVSGKGTGDAFDYLYTNLPTKLFSPFEIWLVHRLNWQIELFFRLNKRYCFLNGCNFKHAGVSDFFSLSALIAYHMKILMSQVVQQYSGKTLSMISSCKVSTLAMPYYFGIQLFAVSPPNVDDISKRALKRRERVEEQRKRYECYGVFSFIYDLLRLTVTKARISTENYRQIRGSRAIAEYLQKLNSMHD